MSPMDASPGPRPAGRQEAERLLKQFDDAWQTGPPPQIGDFLPLLRATGAVSDDAVSRELLEELIAIDLAHRWQRSTSTAGNPWLLEHYVARYLELGPLKQLSVELIAEEYWARRRWSDRPSHADYALRFPHHAVELGHKLAEIDAELDAEFDPNGRTLANEDDGPERPPADAIKLVEAGASLLSGGRLPPAERPLDTIADLLVSLRQSQLLSLAQLNEIIRADLQGHFATARALAGQLLQRDWLTPYQANQLLLGRGQDLVLGPYLLLQRLGEGGAGQVFKARHQKMNRLVAVKVIRPELLADAEAVGRFSREIQVLSRLDHPNVVHAYDAGPCGVSYFLAMEYIEGTDLARLVKQCGPLPVMQACAYIRQAALGLQHAHERGLVHRDIKPHNLIMSLREGRIKVADLGLARLPRPANEEATAALAAVKSGGSLTPVGAFMMGTLDYLAPEQALDFHKADIRADIYSLGCTLWYLLIGRPPFPEGTLAEKLLSHQSKEPPVIDKLRSDVPVGLARVLRRMLAKRPEDRYRTPAEVAEAVTPYISTPDARELGIDVGGWSVRATAYTTWEMLRMFARRNKAFTAAVVTAMVLLAWSSVVNYRANKKYEQERKRTLEAVPAIVEAARRAVDRQQFDNALTLVDLALTYDPERSEARLLKGQMLIVLKEFARAKEALERYLRQQPADKNAERLVDLCGRERPDKEDTLLVLADVFEQQGMPALAEGLLKPIATSSVEARKKLLPVYRDRIEKRWKGLRNRLTLDYGGIYQLDLSKCTEVEALDVLQGIPLTVLNLTGRGVQDLKPLNGMPLRVLDLTQCLRVHDLTPLNGMPLSTLNLQECEHVSSLSPLEGMRLTTLHLLGCRGVQDLSPLKGMPLAELSCSDTGVRDVTPLHGMQLTNLWLPGPEGIKGVEKLRSMKTLERINNLPVEEFWKQYDMRKSKEYKK